MKKIDFFETPAFLLLSMAVAAFAIICIDVAEAVGSESKTDLAILSLVEDFPRNPANKDQYRAELVAAFDQSGARHNIDPLLLVAMSFLESSFKTDVIGYKRGERGLLQVHGVASLGCNLKTAAGQIDCGAKYLRGRIDHCGSLERGLMAYATGKCDCKKYRALWSVRRRLAFWKRLKSQS